MRKESEIVSYHFNITGESLKLLSNGALRLRRYAVPGEVPELDSQGAGDCGCGDDANLASCCKRKGEMRSPVIPGLIRRGVRECRPSAHIRMGWSHSLYW